MELRAPMNELRE